jgi:hypothetical protein
MGSRELTPRQAASAQPNPLNQRASAATPFTVFGAALSSIARVQDPIRRPTAQLNNGLSSPLGGDSRDATPANLLLTGRFQATVPASKVAHFREASVRAHSAGLPWPAGDLLSQTPRSTTTGTGTRQATTHRQQNPLLTTKRDCPRNCVGLSERDRHAYDYEKQDPEEQGQDRAGAARRGA